MFRPKFEHDISRTHSPYKDEASDGMWVPQWTPCTVHVHWLLRFKSRRNLPQRRHEAFGHRHAVNKGNIAWLLNTAYCHVAFGYSWSHVVTAGILTPRYTEVRIINFGCNYLCGAPLRHKQDSDMWSETSSLLAETLTSALIYFLYRFGTALHLHCSVYVRARKTSRIAVFRRINGQLETSTDPKSAEWAETK
jgi:hypothetical protein